MKYKLKPCGCGKTPTKLYITPEGPVKWAYTYGDCCGEWHLKFKTQYHTAGKPECMELAVKAWNQADRGCDE